LRRKYTRTVVFVGVGVVVVVDVEVVVDVASFAPPQPAASSANRTPMAREAALTALTE